MADSILDPKSKSSKNPRHGPLATLREDIEKLFGEFWHESNAASATGVLLPKLDLSENDASVFVRVDLPGVNPEEIDLKVNGNFLTITGERKDTNESNGETFHRIERRVGHFSRSVTLPCEVTEKKIEATYTDGVVSIVLPKADEAKSRRIPVKPK